MSRIPQLTAFSTAMWDILGEQILSSPAASISFSGIATSRTTFRLTGYIIRDTTSTATQLRFNNDSGANYDYQQLRATSTTILKARTTGANSLLFFNFNIAASEEGNFVTVVSKPVAGQEAQTVQSGGYENSGVILEMKAEQWNNTADLINRIDVISGADNFDTNTRILLEGAKPA